MLFLPINRNWVLSQAAQYVYLGAAVLSLALLATLIGIDMAISAAGMALTAEARLLVKLILFPEILGAGLLWVAMWYFWFGFDRSHYLLKTISFVLLFFFGPLGTSIYYFAGYRRWVSASASSKPGLENVRPKTGASLSDR
jgi:hypothetical protein